MFFKEEKKREKGRTWAHALAWWNDDIMSCCSETIRKYIHFWLMSLGFEFAGCWYYWKRILNNVRFSENAANTSCIKNDIFAFNDQTEKRMSEK